VLREVARRLRAGLRASDTVARIGGDEFALILTALPRPEAAGPLAAKILEGVTAPLTLDDQDFEIRASLGTALFPSDGETGEQLLQNADMAMYRAKALGGGCHPFAATVKHDFERRRSLERDLARALRTGELSLDYQPQQDLRDGRLTGFEALLRWQHPRLGPIPPETVIAVAEASGQSGAIGEWALDSACRAAVAWPADGETALRVAVNLSAMQLTRPDLTHRVARALGASGLPPGRLELEVTETTAFADVERATLVLRELHDMGVALALDDVGTGYGSLSHLKLFPLDALKIDRSFTAGIARGAEAAPDLAIVHSLIELGQRLGLRVIAEGVETEAQLQALARLGCDEIQGHVVGEPLGEATVAGWLGQRQMRLAAARA
jgi:predicted signal transduction protein with EAL and GGDEF domain